MDKLMYYFFMMSIVFFIYINVFTIFYASLALMIAVQKKIWWHFFFIAFSFSTYIVILSDAISGIVYSL